MRNRALLAIGIPDLPELAFAPSTSSRPATLEGGGGGSSSSSSSTNNVDKRQVVDSGIGVTSDSSTVYVTATPTDLGAIKGALDLAATNTAAQGKSFEEVLGFAKSAIDLTQAASNNVAQAYQTAGDLSTGNRTIATTGLVIAGIVAAAVVLGKTNKVF